MRFKRSRRGGGRSGALRRRSARDPGTTRPAPSPTPAASSATPAPMHVRSAPHSMREPSSRRLRSARHVWRAKWSSICHFLVRARRLSWVEFVDCILEGVKSCRKFQFRTVQDSGSGSRSPSNSCASTQLVGPASRGLHGARLLLTATLRAIAVEALRCGLEPPRSGLANGCARNASRPVARRRIGRPVVRLESAWSRGSLGRTVGRVLSRNAYQASMRGAFREVRCLMRTSERGPVHQRRHFSRVTVMTCPSTAVDEPVSLRQPGVRVTTAWRG